MSRKLESLIASTEEIMTDQTTSTQQVVDEELDDIFWGTHFEGFGLERVVTAPSTPVEERAAAEVLTIGALRNLVDDDIF